ncbi:MAG: carboxypeptidase regulatory-like domain-containing protein [Chitinophagaceae bacterium]|nr:carboxypeptidase regulatory-like domain-containing protein [Chitinophagaceae bacterium]
MSDAQVVQLFQKNTDTHCIRAFASQLNRPIALPAQAPTRFYRIALALGLTILSFAAADTYARPRPPLVEQNYLLNGEDSTKKGDSCAQDLKIRGIILDETNNIFPGAFVSLIQNGNVKSVVITEDDGSFELTLVDIKNDSELESFKLVASSLGYEKNEIMLKKELINYSLEIKMKVQAFSIGGGHLIQDKHSIKQSIGPPGRKTYNAKDLKNFGL